MHNYFFAATICTFTLIYAVTRGNVDDQHHTMARPLPPCSGNPKSLASYVMDFFRSRWPTPKTHGHLRMPSTPGVGYYSGRYRIFPARRQMHGNASRRARIGLRQPPRPSDRRRVGIDVCGGGSSFVWRLAGRLNPPTGDMPRVTAGGTYRNGH